MKIRLSVVGVAAATALTALLTACSSSGGGPSVNLADLGGPGSSTAAAGRAPVTPSSRPTGTSVVGRDSSANAGGKTVAAPAEAGFPNQHSSAPSAPRTSSSVTAPSSAVTYRSISFPRPYNCAQSGTTYYTAPNVTAAMDVTVLVTSQTLAHDLVITAPNRAPRGLSNASQWVASKVVANGVWQATYRTFVALYEPRFAPVTVSSLQASAGGASYTISFPSPVSVDLNDCHS